MFDKYAEEFEYNKEEVRFKDTEKAIQMTLVKTLYGLGAFLGDPNAKTLAADIVKSYSDRPKDNQPLIMPYLQVAAYLMPTLKLTERFNTPKV